MTDIDPALERVAGPRHTQRLTLRRALAGDVEATWSFRRLDAVNRWLTRAPRTLDEYRPQFEDPASLAKTLVIERDGEVIGDLMLALEDAWSQADVQDHARHVQAELGWVLHPGTVTPSAIRRQIRFAVSTSSSHRAGTIRCMERRTISAAELEQMTPSERSAAFEASIVWDLDDAPASLGSRSRQWVVDRIAEEEHQPAE